MTNPRSNCHLVVEIGLKKLIISLYSRELSFIVQLCFFSHRETFLRYPNAPLPLFLFTLMEEKQR
jgi:hypothetical protein